MEHGKLGLVLDLLDLVRTQLNDLFQQQHQLCWESIDRMVALADLPMPMAISSVKPRKGSTCYFQANEGQELSGNLDEKENNLPGGTFVGRGPLPKSSKKASARSTRRRKPLGDSQNVNQSRQLLIGDRKELDEDVVFEQQQRRSGGLARSVEGKNRGNERLVHSQEGSKRGNKGSESTSLADEENGELTHPVGRNRSTSTIVSPSHPMVAGEAEESLVHPENRRSANSVPTGDRPIQVKAEISPDLDAPRLTRNQARMLRNAEANLTITRGEPPLKKRRGRKGIAVPSDSPAAAAAEENETAGEKHTTVAQITLEQLSREAPYKEPPVVNKKKSRARLRSPAETNGEEGATVEKQDTEVLKMEIRPTKTSCFAEEEDGKGEGRPSKKSRTSFGSTKLNIRAQAEANAFEFDNLEKSSSDAHATTEDYNCKDVSPTKTCREPNRNIIETVLSSSVGNDGIVGVLWTAGVNKKEGIHTTAAADDQLGNASHPLDERNAAESPQFSMNGIAAELRFTCGLAKSREVESADPVKVLIADGRLVCDSPSECLANAEDRIQSLVRKSGYKISRRTTILLSPPMKTEVVDRKSDLIVLDHRELKDENTVSNFKQVGEEQMVNNLPQPVREGRPRGFSFPLAERDSNSSESTKVVGHSLALELDIRESKMDGIGDERAGLQLPAARESGESVEAITDGISVLQASTGYNCISLPERDGDGVDNEGLHSTQGTVLHFHESVDVSNLPGQPPQIPITHRYSAGTPVGRERQLTELVVTSELEGKELIGEESDPVSGENRLTLLLTTPERVELANVEAGAVRHHELAINMRINLLETSALQDCQGGPISHTTADETRQDNPWEEPKVIIPQAVGMNPSAGQEGRTETTESEENRELNVSVQKWDRRKLLAIGENKSLVSFLSSLGRVARASVQDNHQVDKLAVHRSTDESSELHYGRKEVDLTVTRSEQSLKPSKALGSINADGIAPIDSDPPNPNAQYNSDVRLSRLIPSTQVGHSWMVADVDENNAYQSRITMPQRLHDGREGSGTGNEIEVIPQPKWTDRDGNNAMPFSMDKSSVSFQNKKAADLLLALWMRGGMEGSDLALPDRPPSSSELAGRNYKLDVVDEVYRSVIVRECGGGGGSSSFTLPIANWSTGMVCNMTRASSQFGPRMMERSWPLSHRLEVQEVAEGDSVEDSKMGQEGKIIKPSLLLIEDQDQSTQDSVSALANSVVDYSLEIDGGCEVSSQSEFRVREQRLSQEDANMSKLVSLSRIEEDSTVSSVPHNPEDSAVPVVDLLGNADGPVDTPQEAANSNIVKSQKPFSNLIAGMRSFVPVIQKPPPSFIPDGKRPVKVKALVAAEAAKKAEEEKRDVKERLRCIMRRAEDSASSGREKKEGFEANIPPKEADEGRKLMESVEGSKSSCGSQLSPRKKASTRSNSRNLFSPEAKSKQAANSEIEKKVKKKLAEIKRMEEERKRKLMASRQLKEQLVLQKLGQRQESLKQKREQKLVAEQEDKVQKALWEVEREKMAIEEKIKSKQCSPGTREREYDQVDELKVKCALQRVSQTGQAKPAQTPGEMRSSVLRVATLSSRSAVRVPVVSRDKQTATMVAAAVLNKGRHPSTSSSSSKLLLNAEPARLPAFNAEEASRLPSLNAVPERSSSLNAQCAAEGGPQNSTHALRLGNRPAEVQQQGRTGENLSCSGTPCSKAAEKEEDLGPMSYDISPYRGSSDDESEDEKEQPAKPAKHIPFWARKESLDCHLLKQFTLDPDEIFSGRKTCSLKEVFGKTGSKKIQDFGKRSGSGDWFKDRVSWKEELQYKIDMGYVQNNVPTSFS